MQSKWLVAVLFMTLIWRHDPGTLWAVIGVSLNGILAIALKMILNQARPISTLKADPGMPSSHAQFMFYAVAFINLSSNLFEPFLIFVNFSHIKRC